MIEAIKYYIRRFRKLDYIEKHVAKECIIINVYENGKCIDGEVFWIEDDFLSTDVDKSVTRFKKVYKIKKYIE